MILTENHCTAHAASLRVQGICGAVSRALLLSHPERVALGREARQLFEANRREFEHRMARLPALLRHLAADATSVQGAAL